MFLILGDDLGSKCSNSALLQVLVIILLNVDLLLDLVNVLSGNIASKFKSIRNLQRVDALVQQSLRLVQESTS
jgi:hypothetical protein